MPEPDEAIMQQAIKELHAGDWQPIEQVIDELIVSQDERRVRCLKC